MEQEDDDSKMEQEDEMDAKQRTAKAGKQKRNSAVLSLDGNDEPPKKRQRLNGQCTVDDEAEIEEDQNENVQHGGVGQQINQHDEMQVEVGEEPSAHDELVQWRKEYIAASTKLQQALQQFHCHFVKVSKNHDIGVINDKEFLKQVRKFHDQINFAQCYNNFEVVHCEKL